MCVCGANSSYDLMVFYKYANAIVPSAYRLPNGASAQLLSFAAIQYNVYCKYGG